MICSYMQHMYDSYITEKITTTYRLLLYSKPNKIIISNYLEPLYLGQKNTFSDFSRQLSNSLCFEIIFRLVGIAQDIKKLD